MRRTPVIAVVLVIAGLLAGCSTSGPGADTPSWKVGASVEVITAAPDAGGLLSFRNCPTLAEAKAAVPALTGGPDANAVPFKTMILQCSYAMDERDIQGRPAGIGILVFDATGEGLHLWDSARTDPDSPNATDIPGLAEVAFATGSTGHDDLWVVQGPFGFHMSHTRRGEIPLDEMVALARSMLTGLARPPR
jgi:predicted small secreted protein